MQSQPVGFVLLILMAAVRTGIAADTGGEETAVTVFKAVQPSVVGLENAECTGSGIVLDSSGLILTNAHIAVSPLPFRCKVDIADGGETRQVTFKKVEVVGFHPRLDLALMRIDPASEHVTLKPVTICRKKGDPGQTVFVIGNPAGGGMVLSKTITSGMLSAVDREVDGDPYYQIDAAINPGNSGGPICNRAGQVLGLVTFRFVDVQNIGFAIPLQDLDPKAFVPLMQRKGNPDVAQKIIVVAQKLHTAANDAARREGRNSPRSKLLNEYSAYCYRLALVYDSANPDLYGKIGDLFTFVGQDELAISYLLRFFRMHPWDSPQLYANVGFSYGKLKKQPEQAVVWQEGLAKFPWHGMLWEDMAFNHKFYHRDAEAAYCASMALFIGVRRDRFDVVKRLLEESIAKLNPDDKAKFDARVTTQAKLATLDEMTDRSNDARKRRKLYMDKDFADLVAAGDGPPFPSAAGQIPQTPQERPARWRNVNPTAH